MGYLLDTNIISDLVRNPRGPVAQRLRELREAGEKQAHCSIIVAAELRYGVTKRGGKRFAEKVEAVLATLNVLPFHVPADAVYARLRVNLERRGQVIGGNDLLIAAHAIASGHTLVTANEQEFSRIAELACENWLTA